MRRITVTMPGLTQMGVNLVRLAPGAWSSQRHWHAHEDEFVYMLTGELVLVTDDGEEILVAGNRHDADHGEYSDIDMAFKPGRYSAGASNYFHKDGRPY